MKNISRNNNILYEVVPIRLVLIALLVFYHAFAIFSGVWSPITGYPEIPLYDIMDKLSYACLLETFVFISGYILGFQVSKKGEVYIKNEKPLPTVVYNILSGTGHMWFLPMLFWCFVFVFLAEKTKLSIKWMVGASFIMLFASVLPLPFRINTAMYYFAFFYTGYCIKKYEWSIPHDGTWKYILLLAGFASAFVLKIYICELENMRMGGGHSTLSIFAVDHIS